MTGAGAGAGAGRGGKVGAEEARSFTLAILRPRGAGTAYGEDECEVDVVAMGVRMEDLRASTALHGAV